MLFFENLDKTTVRNLIEYIDHAGAWVKNNESDSRVAKMKKLLEADTSLNEYIKKHTIKKEYHKLWSGTKWKINEDDYFPKKGDTIRREDRPYQKWTQRKSMAIKISGFQEAVEKPQSGGAIVMIKKPVTGDHVILDVNGVFNLLNQMRKDPKSLKQELIDKFQEEYDSDYMYRIFNSLRRIIPSKDHYDVLTDESVNIAKIIADYSHNRGLMETNGEWKTNKKTELL